MSKLTLTVNGRPITADPEPRLHLADFLRDQLGMTGTHLGCEHGVCGACTLLIDGQPVRSCLTLAAECAGRRVESIEAMDDDLVMTRLRAAFTAHHALQCGYCTPGMLITARDIVVRLPAADDDRIRLELAGNLCRCTGYNGIVRAIRTVLDEKLAIPPPERAPLATLSVRPAAPVITRQQTKEAPSGDGLRQSLRLALSRDQIWQALQDPAAIAACIPGVRLDQIGPDHISGEMQASLGPVRTLFSGHARLTYQPADFRGSISGEGRDRATGTMLTATADFSLTKLDDDHCRLDLVIDYDLQGGLAPLARRPVVALFAAEMAQLAASNIEAHLRGEEPPLRRFGRLALLGRIVRRWLMRGRA